jgi:hypothetical protein
MKSPSLHILLAGRICKSFTLPALLGALEGHGRHLNQRGTHLAHVSMCKQSQANGHRWKHTVIYLLLRQVLRIPMEIIHGVLVGELGAHGMR